MKQLWRSSSPLMRNSEGLREKQTHRLSRQEQIRQLLVEFVPLVIANLIIELYAARPSVGAMNYQGSSIQIFSGDWTSPPKSILIEPRLALMGIGPVCDVCEVLGSLVIITLRYNEYITIVRDNQGNLQQSRCSPDSHGTLVKVHGKLYTFGSTHFASFDPDAKCFLPDIKLPSGYTRVTAACEFKGGLFLLKLTKWQQLRLSCFNIRISRWTDLGPFPDVSISQMCANDKGIYFYGLGGCKSNSCGHDPCCWGFILTWNHNTGLTEAERVAGVMRLITCDNDYIYFINSFNMVVLYDTVTRQLVPDPAHIDDAARMHWFDVSSPELF